LKNFIRHGKQARSPEHLPPPTPSASYPPCTDPDRIPIPEPIYQAPEACFRIRPQGEFNEAAARIVAEEREARNRFPRYLGLERFKLVEKMGEYGAFRRRLLILAVLFHCV
jgi:hypothetical protein